MNYCRICGVEIDDDEELCEDCMDDLASNILLSDSIEPDVGDL